MNQKNGKMKAIGIIALMTTGVVFSGIVISAEQTKTVRGFRIKNGIPDAQAVMKIKADSLAIKDSMLLVQKKVGKDTVHDLLPMNHPIDSTVLSKDTLIYVSIVNE